MFIMLNYLIMVKTMGNLTNKQEAFALKYAECGNASEAYRHAYNAENMKQETIAKKAHYLLKQEKIRGMVENLKQEFAQAEKHMAITSRARRLEMLDYVANAGMTKLITMDGTEKHENLSATLKAIEIVNGMVGNIESESSQKPITVNISVAKAKGDIRVTRGSGGDD